MIPVKQTARERESWSPEEQGETEHRARRPRLEPAEDEAETMELARPHQAFVESRLRQYLQDNNIRSLIKPTREEIREAAKPILISGLRRRTGSDKYVYPSIALRAVADLVQHAREQGWVERNYCKAYASPFYIDSLIQLADDAGWLRLEITLPGHDGPPHPPIYYMMNWERGRAVPREGNLIRSEYVHHPEGNQVTPAPYIHPWRELSRFPSISELLNRRWSACYMLRSRKSTVWVVIYWLENIGTDVELRSSKLEYLLFSREPE